MKMKKQITILMLALLAGATMTYAEETNVTNECDTTYIKLDENLEPINYVNWSKEDLENERLRNEVKLLKAKTEALESQKHVEELYADAMKAFKTYYSGTSSEDDYDEDIQ